MMQNDDLMKKPEEQGQDSTQVFLNRRSFLAMGASAAAAFSLPPFNFLSDDGTAAAAPTSNSNCFNGLVCGDTGFPQPYNSPNNLGEAGNLINLDLEFQAMTVNEAQNVVVFRSYNLRDTPKFERDATASLTPGKQYFKLGPTFTFTPSDPKQNALHLNFTNKITAVDPDIVPAQPPSPNTGELGVPGRPKGFSSANLHFHGLHVSPSSHDKNGNIVCGLESRVATKSSDDMLFYMTPRNGLKEEPPSHEYEVVLPKFHAPGTHWYHAHNDGSTGLHVVDGTAGALLVKDEGDAVIDVDQDLLWIVQELEGTDLLTELQVDAAGTKKDVPTDQLVYNCAPKPKNYGFTVNGVFQPSMTMKVNELHRWRFLAGTATPRGFMRISLYKIPDTVPAKCTTYQFTYTIPTDGSTYTEPTGCTCTVNADQNTKKTCTCPCTIPNSAPPPAQTTDADKAELANYTANLSAFLKNSNPTKMNLMAIDGISFYGDSPQSVACWDMSPANRADFLVQLSESGNYWVVKEGFNVKGNFNGDTPNAGPGGTQVLGTITVTKEEVASPKPIPVTIPGAFPKYLQKITDDQLLKNADGSKYIRPVVFAIAKEAIGVGCGDYKGNIKPAMPTSRLFTVNNKAYSAESLDKLPRYTPPSKEPDKKYKEYQPGEFSAPKAMPETVQIVHLNTCEEWIVYNYSNLVHPFHIHVNPFLLIESHDPNGTTNQQGINRWWDSIGIPAAKFNGKTLIEPGYVRIHSRFWDYWGEYVFHCHILVHEDQGMMQNVYVANDTINPGSGPFEQVDTSYDLNISECKKIGIHVPAGCYPQSYPAFQPIKNKVAQYPEQASTDCLPGGKTCDSGDLSLARKR